VTPGISLLDRPTSANVAEALTDVTTASPDRAALLGPDGRSHWTFAELADHATRIASGLVRRGLRPGDRVGLLVRDPEEALIVAVATLWAGGTVVAPPRSGGWWPAFRAVNGTRPTAVVADPTTWLALAAAPGFLGVRIRVTTGRRRWPGFATLADLAADGDVAAGPAFRPADAPALVSWTTGSTGRPHAVVRTHGVLTAQHAAIHRLRSPRPGDVDLVGLPTMALHDLACGVSMIMPPRSQGLGSGTLLRALVTRTAVTTAVGFPALFERLTDGAGPAALPGLRSIHVGGAPVRTELLDRLALVAPSATVVVVYGATEVEPIAAVEATELRSSATRAALGRGMLVGRPCDGIDLRVVPIEGRTRATISGAVPGRILVRGDRVAPDPIRSDPDGWLDTGDVGTIDADGRLWLLGRASNMVAGGVTPAEIEQPVAALDEVQASAVVPVSRRDGPRLVLAVQPAANAAAAAVQARVVTMASERGWTLDRVAVVRRMPRDARSGKVDYMRLRARVR
jgi:acyl-CoA synthetase (AMP-forming)/AMP-acid ligase II